MADQMHHASKNKQKPLSRVRRIAGQVAVTERALRDQHECSSVLQLMAACRGAFERSHGGSGHIRFHVLAPGNAKNSSLVEAADELIDVAPAYLR